MLLVYSAAQAYWAMTWKVVPVKVTSVSQIDWFKDYSSLVGKKLEEIILHQLLEYVLS